MEKCRVIIPTSLCKISKNASINQISQKKINKKLEILPKISNLVPPSVFPVLLRWQPVRPWSLACCDCECLRGAQSSRAASVRKRSAWRGSWTCCQRCSRSGCSPTSWWSPASLRPKGGRRKTKVKTFEQRSILKTRLFRSDQRRLKRYMKWLYMN